MTSDPTATSARVGRDSTDGSAELWWVFAPGPEPAIVIFGPNFAFFTAACLLAARIVGDLGGSWAAAKSPSSEAQRSFMRRLSPVLGRARLAEVVGNGSKGEALGYSIVADRALSFPIPVSGVVRAGELFGDC